MVSRLRKNDNAYLILAGVLVFGGMLCLVNFIVCGTTASTEEFNTAEETNFWDNPLGWIGEQVTGSPVFSFFTLDMELTENLGELGSILRVIYPALIILGIIDLIWIG